MVFFVFLCAFFCLQSAQAADPVQTSASNKTGDPAAANKALIDAIQNFQRNGANAATKGASTNQPGSSNSVPGTNAAPNPAQLAANALPATPVTNTAAAATNLSQTSVTNSVADTTNTPVVLDDKYKLAIGDHLSFKILEDEDESKLPGDARLFFVTDSGDLDVPYIGRVPAENKTCRQLAAEIKTALEKEYYYQATVLIAVDLMTKSHGRVYLVGAVRLPGPVELPNDEVLTLSKAVLRAGGFTDYADRRHVKVTRKDTLAKDATPKEMPGKHTTAKDVAGKDDKETFTVDVGEIFDKGKIETDLTLQNGDLIYVPDRLIRF
jgi:protein involved in polysaccharide export with SLBB domain